MLQYLAVWQAMVSVHRPTHSKIMLARLLGKLTNVSKRKSPLCPRIVLCNASQVTLSKIKDFSYFSSRNNPLVKVTGYGSGCGQL